MSKCTQECQCYCPHEREKEIKKLRKRIAADTARLAELGGRIKPALDEGDFTDITANRVDDVEDRLRELEDDVKYILGHHITELHKRITTQAEVHIRHRDLQAEVNHDVDVRLEGLEDDMCRVLK